MSNLTIKTTLISLDKAEYFSQSTRTHKPILSPKLTETFSILPPHGVGDASQMPDWDLLQDLNAELVEQSVQEVRAAGRDYREKRGQLTEVRRERKNVAKKLRQNHRNLQASFKSTYVDPPLELYGLDVPAVARYVALREQCLESIDRLEDEELASKLGEVRAGHTPLDLAALASDMKGGVKRFEELHNAITEMKKISDEALVARRAATRRHRRIYANVARVQEGLCRLAGLDELADRIRVTIPARPSKKEEETGDGSEEPSEAATEK